MNSFNLSIRNYLSSLFAVILLAGCNATHEPLASPAEFATLELNVIKDNTGEYLSPITSDGIPAEWVDNSINAAMGAGIGSAVGAYAGAKLLEQVPFVGGFLGAEVGDAIGREAAISMAGGEETIRETSDLSFNNLEDLAIYLYATYGDNPNYQDVLSATSEIYPDLKQINYVALNNASSLAKSSAAFTTNAE